VILPNHEDCLFPIGGAAMARLKKIEDFSCLVRSDDGKNSNQEKINLHSWFENGATKWLAAPQSTTFERQRR
jgi:hypothetical protein